MELPSTLAEYIWAMHGVSIIWTPSAADEQPPF